MIPSVHYLSLFWAKWIQSTFKTHFNIILPSKLKSFIYSVLFRLLTKVVSAFLISPIYSTSNTHLDLLILIVLTELGTDYKTHKSNYTIFSSLSSLPLLHFQIFYYAESSYTLHLYCSFHTEDHISYLNKTAGFFFF